MEAMKHAQLPWEVKYSPGAGWQIKATLPKGFKFDCTDRGADGQTQFMTWATVESPQSVLIGYERWVQFETNSWKEMQEANAELIRRAVNNHQILVDALTAAILLLKFQQAGRSSVKPLEDVLKTAKEN